MHDCVVKILLLWVNILAIKCLLFLNKFTIEVTFDFCFHRNDVCHYFKKDAICLFKKKFLVERKHEGKISETNFRQNVTFSEGKRYKKVHKYNLNKEKDFWGNLGELKQIVNIIIELNASFGYSVKAICCKMS